MPLLTKDQRVHIPLYYIEKKTKGGTTKPVVLEEKKAKEMLEDPKQKDKVQILNTHWKVLNWRDQNSITNQAMFYDEEQRSQDINPFKYRDLRIKSCLVAWDMKDEEGNDIEVNEENIDSLPAEIVFALVFAYDTLATIEDDEEKK